jgi:hypothetical protein
VRDSIWIVALVTAVFATGLAIWAGPNLTIAVPAAVAAVAIGVGVGIWRALKPAPPATATSALPKEPTPLLDLEGALHSGALGRDYVLILLDTLDRRLRDRNLPKRAEKERQRLLSGPDAAFRAYVEGRVTELERES